jgi:hypothetical protein
LQLRDRQSPGVDREAHAIGVALRHVGRISRDRAPVEDAGQHGDVVRRLHASADAQARERVGGAAAGQIDCWQSRPTGHPVDEEGVSAWGDDEFLVEALLTDLDVELVAEFLLIPQLPEPDADRRLDVGQGLQDQKIVQGQIATPILQAAHVERAAFEPERLLGVHYQRHGGEPVPLEALLDAATEVAERLDVLEDGQRDPVIAERWPKPAHVAEQVLILPRRAEESERRAALGGHRRARRRCGLGLRRRRRSC